MTSPFGQEVVKVPGVGEEFQNAIAPFVQAIQFRQAQQRQQLAERQRIAAELFARGLQSPGFENTPAAQQLEVELGVPGLGASISKARTAEERRKVEDINTFVEGLSGVSDRAKSGLRASLIAGTKGATADVQNSLFAAMAAGEDLTVLERARLENLQANTQRIQLEIERMKREPGPHDQERAAQLLGINVQSDFVQGLNYIGVLEDLLKDRNKEADPGRAILSTAVSLMTLNKDILGRPALTPQEAFQTSLELVKNVFPKSASTSQLTPNTEQALGATRAAMLMWQGLRMDDNALKDAQGRVLRKFKTTAEIRQYIAAEMKHVFPLVEQSQLDMLMDVVQRRVTESF